MSASIWTAVILGLALAVGGVTAYVENRSDNEEIADLKADVTNLENDVEAAETQRDENHTASVWLRTELNDAANVSVPSLEASLAYHQRGWADTNTSNETLADTLAKQCYVERVPDHATTRWLQGASFANCEEAADAIEGINPSLHVRIQGRDSTDMRIVVTDPLGALNQTSSGGGSGGSGGGGSSSGGGTQGYPWPSTPGCNPTGCLVSNQHSNFVANLPANTIGTTNPYAWQGYEATAIGLSCRVGDNSPSGTVKLLYKQSGDSSFRELTLTSTNQQVTGVMPGWQYSFSHSGQSAACNR